MDDTTITIGGLDDVTGTLFRLPERIAKQAFRRALSAAAVPVVRNLTPRIPVKTGDLKEHLETKVHVYENELAGVASIGFGTEGWKARMVELGHRMIGHEPDHKDIGEVSPEPFMGPAAAASGDAAIEAFADSISDSVDDLRKVS